MVTVSPASDPVASPSWKRQIARRCLAKMLPVRWLLVNGTRNSGTVCLTFDDGPHPDHTPRLLDVLKLHQVPATFFVVGARVAAYPAVVRRIVDEGHSVGHHSFYHGDPARTSARDLLDEVRRTDDVLTAVVGRCPTFFRPPHGKLTIGKTWRLWRAGQSIVLWNVDPKDWSCADARELHSRMKGRSLQGGDVLLLHDSHPHGAALVPELVAEAQCSGLRFATIPEWLGQAKSLSSANTACTNVPSRGNRCDSNS